MKDLPNGTSTILKCLMTNEGTIMPPFRDQSTRTQSKNSYSEISHLSTQNTLKRTDLKWMMQFRCRGWSANESKSFRTTCWRVISIRMHLIRKLLLFRNSWFMKPKWCLIVSKGMSQTILGLFNQWNLSQMKKYCKKLSIERFKKSNSSTKSEIDMIFQTTQGRTQRRSTRTLERCLLAWVYRSKVQRKRVI